MPEYAKNLGNTQSGRQKTYFKKKATIPNVSEEQVKWLRNRILVFIILFLH